MNCQKIQNHLIDFQENPETQLSNDVAEHLTQCNSCSEAFHSLKAAFHSMQKVSNGEHEVSFFFTEQTISKIHSLRQREQSVWQWIYLVLFRRVSVVSASFTAILAGIILGIFLNVNLRSDLNNGSYSDSQTFEEVYLAVTSGDYMTRFFENQKYTENADK